MHLAVQLKVGQEQYRTDMMLARMDACSCQDAATSCQAPTASSRGTPSASLMTVTSGSATALMTSPQKPCSARGPPELPAARSAFIPTGACPIVTLNQNAHAVNE